jgi:amino acid transporter
MAHSDGDAKANLAPLGLWDVVSIMIGIVVGVSIYEVPPFMLQNVSGPGTALGIWALCGLLSFVGALCIAELASTYPHSGGDYVYLTRAFGPWLGFQFGWFQLAAIRTANIAMMGFVFADYAAKLWDVPRGQLWLWTFGAVGVLAFLNLMGVVFGKGTQNFLTLAKVIGLGGVVVAGFGWPLPLATVEPSAPTSTPSLANALVVVFLAYGGWNDAAFVAAEVRGGPKAIARALLLGTAAITLIYVLINAAFLWGLGFERASRSQAIAADLLALPLGEGGKRAMSILVMISALGAINGMLLSGSRVYATMGADHAVFAWLGRSYGRMRTPWAALLAQTAISLVMIAVVGTEGGRALVDSLLTSMSLPPAKWEGHGGFEVLMVFTTPLFWLFFFLTSLSLFALRRRDANIPRPFTVPFYPVLPLLFSGICAYMIYAGITYAQHLGLLGGLFAAAGLLTALGLLLYFLSRRMDRPRDPTGQTAMKPVSHLD